MDTETANKATEELQFSFILQLNIPTKLEKVTKARDNLSFQNHHPSKEKIPETGCL